ncbi:MAG TPA: hypothetical protein VFV34_23445 [Blastocatellia bacterium]|nr:hypothetical protein [Blastocatellia bacterium]
MGKEVAYRPVKKPRSLKRRIVKGILEVLLIAGFLLFAGYASLIGTSDTIEPGQDEIVARAIDVLDRQGFNKEAFFLRNLTRYRSTDNWLNKRVGHESAYAATNFPFEIVTLYQPFFDEPIDDTERAAILLHEAYHLLGHGEEETCSRTWENKRQLGWTADVYQNTKVWQSVRGYTIEHAPRLFQCGEDHRSDCSE